MIALLEIQDFAIIAMLIAVVTGGTALTRSRSTESSRLLRLERKLDAVIENLGIELPDGVTGTELSAAVRELADRGRKIEAIKALREESGMGLRDAKDVVDAYMDRA